MPECYPAIVDIFLHSAESVHHMPHPQGQYVSWGALETLPSGERRLEEPQELGPGPVRLRVVVDTGIEHAPAVPYLAVHLDLGGDAGCCVRFPQRRMSSLVSVA